MKIFDYILLACTGFTILNVLVQTLTLTTYQEKLIELGFLELKLTFFAKLSLFVFPLIVAYRLWG